MITFFKLLFKFLELWRTMSATLGFAEGVVDLFDKAIADVKQLIGEEEE